MAICLEWDAEIEVNEFDVNEDDRLGCPECGSNLEVIHLSPLELATDDDDAAAEDDDDEAELDEEDEEREDGDIEDDEHKE